MRVDCLKSRRTGPSHTLLFKAQRKKRQQLLEEVFCGPLNNSYTGFLLLSYCWNPSIASCQRRNLSVLLQLFLICLRIPPASPNIHLEMYYLKNGIMIRFLFFWVFLKIGSIGVCHLPDKCVCFWYMASVHIVLLFQFHTASQFPYRSRSISTSAGFRHYDFDFLRNSSALLIKENLQ